MYLVTSGLCARSGSVIDVCDTAVCTLRSEGRQVLAGACRHGDDTVF